MLDPNRYPKVNAVLASTLAAVALAGCGSSANKSGSKPHRLIYNEYAQFVTTVLKNYRLASGVNPQKLDPAQKVKVDCVVFGSKYVAPSAGGEWYHIVGPKPWSGEYAATNAFVNGDANGPLASQPVVDPRLKHDVCSWSAPAPQP